MPPRAQRSVRAAIIPRGIPTRGGTEPAPYRPTENTLKTAPPSHSGMVSKGRARRPFLWSFQGGAGREIEIPPRIFLRGSGGVFFQFGKNTSPDAAKHPWHPRLVNRPPTAGCGHPALRSSDGAGSKSRRASPAPPAIQPTPHFPSCNPERLC